MPHAPPLLMYVRRDGCVRVRGCVVFVRVALLCVPPCVVFRCGRVCACRGCHCPGVAEGFVHAAPPLEFRLACYPQAAKLSTREPSDARLCCTAACVPAEPSRGRKRRRVLPGRSHRGEAQRAVQQRLLLRSRGGGLRLIGGANHVGRQGVCGVRHPFHVRLCVQLLRAPDPAAAEVHAATD